jgi:starch synthase
VRNYDAATGEGTGFTFDDYTPEALLGTLRWALGVFPQGDAWRRLQQAGMRQDYSWDSSARAYERVYERARESR